MLEPNQTPRQHNKSKSTLSVQVEAGHWTPDSGLDYELDYGLDCRLDYGPETGAVAAPDMEDNCDNVTIKLILE